MAKAALEAINGFNLFGPGGTAWSRILVDMDALNRNRMILESLLPRESPSRAVDAGLLPAVSFPAFATHNESLYNSTKDVVLQHLASKGEWGLKRFHRDGCGTAIEPQHQRFYPEGKTPEFENIESEWPLFYAYLIIDAEFMGKEGDVDKFQKLLKRRLCYTDDGGN